MFEKLREIGVPTTIATTICVVVIVAPLLFKIDERYVKFEDHEKELHKLELKNNQLERELAQLSGFQSAMVTLIQQGRIPQPPAPAEVVADRPTRMMTPRAVEIVVPPSAAGTPTPVAPAASVPAPAPAPLPIEAPRNWTGIKDGLERQQLRLAK